MVNLWWIAGETWCVDGHFSGSENFPVCQDLFLRDSHFGNPVCVWAEGNERAMTARSFLDPRVLRFDGVRQGE
jgi:hypothetical protein